MALFARWFGGGERRHAVRLRPGDTVVDVVGKQTVLDAALAQGVPLKHDCRAGGCGACKCRLLSGTVKELTDKSFLLSAEEMRDNFILACQSVPTSDLEIAASWQEASLPAVSATFGVIEAQDALTHDILRVRISLDEPMSWVAGQSVELVAQDGAAAGVARRYSLARAPVGAGNRAIELFIRKVPGGRFTEWLFAADRRGARLQVRGPLGDFALREAGAPLVLIAGGSGLAPIFAMLEAALTGNACERPTNLIFGARRQEDLYLLDELNQIARQWQAPFAVTPVLAEEAEGSGWRGRRGIIPTHLSELLGPLPTQHHAYLCGPPGMIDACSASLLAAGLTSEQIHADRFLDSRHVPAALAA